MVLQVQRSEFDPQNPLKNKPGRVVGTRNPRAGDPGTGWPALLSQQAPDSVRDPVSKTREHPRRTPGIGFWSPHTNVDAHMQLGGLSPAQQLIMFNSSL